MEAYRAVVVTVSDSASQGLRLDASGDTAEEILEQLGIEVVGREVVPDERDRISELLKHLSDHAPEPIHCVVTTGGTGVGPRDVTPEATLDAAERLLPGMAEAMRMESLKKTPFAMTSRQVVGVRNKTLIINLPGSPKAVRECLEVVAPVLKHVVQVLGGNTSHESSDS